MYKKTINALVCFHYQIVFILATGKRTRLRQKNKKKKHFLRNDLTSQSKFQCTFVRVSWQRIAWQRSKHSEAEPIVGIQMSDLLNFFIVFLNHLLTISIEQNATADHLPRRVHRIQRWIATTMHSDTKNQLNFPISDDVLIMATPPTISIRILFALQRNIKSNKFTTLSETFVRSVVWSFSLRINTELF